MRLYNTLTQAIEPFQPLESGRVVLYVCGLTPYDNAHVGHGRTCVAFDMVKRYLRHLGYTVYSIQNITDVDDKIIQRCLERGEDPQTLTERFHDEALLLLDKLHVERASIYPKVTENIPAILAIIQRLLDRGYAYETPTGVYFSVGKFRLYGQLSGQNTGQLNAGARVEVDETKQAPMDFALWKKSKGDLLEFSSPWGRGRPGWHIECSAMNWKHAGRTLDIHGGARDLLFPHHENERAQSEAALDMPLARCWIHTGLVTVEGEKMSKSQGNFIPLQDLLAKFDPNAVRLFFLLTHYRSPLDYSPDAVAAAQESVERIFNTLGLLREEKSVKTGKADAEFNRKMRELAAAFYMAMDNDFDTPNALASLFSLLRLVNHHLSLPAVDIQALAIAEAELKKMLDILGLEEARASLAGRLPGLNALLSEWGGAPAPSPESALGNLIALRESARAKKDYAASDIIRKKLAGLGIVLEDKKGDVRWKVQ